MPQYNLNDKDIKAFFGLTVLKGTPDLIAYPKRKDSVKNDWPEEEGTDIDLAEPHFGARSFTITVALAAVSRDDFKGKYYALFTELKAPGVQRLYSYDLDQTFYIYYSEQQNIKKLTRRINDTRVGLQFDLLFYETNPADNIPSIYLVDDQDRFLIA